MSSISKTVLILLAIILTVLVLSAGVAGDSLKNGSEQNKSKSLSSSAPSLSSYPDHREGMIFISRSDGSLVPLLDPKQNNSGQNYNSHPNPEGAAGTGGAEVFIIFIILIIFGVVLFSGLRIGRTYLYDIPRRSRRWLTYGHIISALLVMCSWIPVLVSSVFIGEENPFPDMIYPIIGVQIYLFLSSVVQGWSLWSDRPVTPLYHVHILFVFVSIILLLQSRGMVFAPFSIMVLSILLFYMPGCILSLITIQMVHRRGFIPQSNDHRTMPRSSFSETIDIPPSFPEKLLAKYHDISVIGSGGMAVVYRAFRNRDGQEVALKIPFSPDEESGRTFLNEVQVWRELHHPNIVEILDQNVFPIPYVEIAYVPRSLRDLTYPVPPERAVSIIRDIGSALIYAHGKGVIHRDIKPGNVLMNPDGRCQLTDWGLSHSLSRGEQNSMMSFSLQYATPEQLAPGRYGSGDERVDVYQLGVLFYELLCGHLPFDSESVGEMFISIQQNEFVLPSSYLPALKKFDEIIIRSLRAQPSERFESISEFIKALDEISS